MSDKDLDLLALHTHQHRHGPILYPDDFLSGYDSYKDTSHRALRIKLKAAVKRKHALKRKVRMPLFTFIDLFAGIGGFRLAGENSRGKCVFTSEKDKYARISYYVNFGEVPFGDITVLANSENISKIPDHDVLCGGFPCQAFSISGNRLGFTEDRGKLFFNITDILRKKKELGQPVKVVFLENVRNFEKHDGGKTHERVFKELSQLGYSVFSVVLNSGQLGAATKRERIYIVAAYDEAFTIQQILEFGSAFKSLKHAAAEPKFLKDCIDGSLSDKEFEMYAINPDRVMTDKEELRKNDDAEKSCPKPRPLQIGVIGKKGDPRMGRQGERIYSTHGHAITFSAYGGGLAARTGAYLIQTADGTKRVRTLTPKECARVMGFERKKGKNSKAMDVNTIAAEGLSDWQLYKQFGNSVVVQTVEIIFKLINHHFFTEKKAGESL